MLKRRRCNWYPLRAVPSSGGRVAARPRSSCHADRHSLIEARCSTEVLVQALACPLFSTRIILGQLWRPGSFKTLFYEHMTSESVDQNRVLLERSRERSRQSRSIVYLLTLCYGSATK